MATIKYPLLSNREWIEERYVQEMLSTTDIAKIIGCTKDGVRVALLRHGISLRSANDSNSIKRKRDPNKSKKYPQLNDKKWLAEKYVDEKWSLNQIKDFIGAKTSNSVRQSLLRFGISIRTVSEGISNANRFARPRGARSEDGFIINPSVLTGCLLGDGFLKRNNRMNDNCYPSFQKKNIFIDHINFCCRQMFIGDFSARVKKLFSKLRSKVFYTYCARSSVHKELLEWDNKWYPEKAGFKKVVPPDVLIDETVLLHWFMDDGHSSYRIRNGIKTGQVTLVFCTECFTKDDQEMLCKKINAKFPSLNPTLNRCNTGTGWRIRIRQKEVNEFLRIIGPCPEEVPSMKYKWKTAFRKKRQSSREQDFDLPL